MLRYAATRLLGSVFLAWGVLTLVFFLVELVPGRPFHELAGTQASPEAAERLRDLFGTDRPVLQRYVDWVAGMVRGDLGLSLGYREPVAGLLAAALANTFRLASAALLLHFVVGAAVGTAAAGSRSAGWDRGLQSWSALTYALPSFCLALLLVGLFAVKLGWLPASQMSSVDAAGFGPWDCAVDAARHLALPCLALGLPPAGGLALYVRDRLREVLATPLVTAARARGLDRRGVLLRHGLPNAAVPVVQLFGLSLPALIGGSVVVEVIFAWPGMGRLAYQAMLARDVPLILGCTLAGAWAVILGSLAADVLAACADPRIRDGLG